MFRKRACTACRFSQLSLGCGNCLYFGCFVSSFGLVDPGESDGELVSITVLEKVMPDNVI